MKTSRRLILLAAVLLCGITRGQHQLPNLIQNIQARQQTTLDGLWQVIVDPLENGYYNHRYQPKENGYFKNTKMQEPSDLVEYDFDSDLELMVPGDWNTQDEKLYYYEGTVWYKRDFDFTPKDGQRYFVYFDGANYHARVYLNGEYLGEHTGGYTPFQFEVTGLLKDQGNFLVVKTDNKRLREGVPTVNTDWWNYGGITRSVRLVSLPEVFLADYKLQLADTGKGIEGWVALSGPVPDQEITVELPELGIKHTSRTDPAGRIRFSLKAAPETWSPQNPKLYTAEIRSRTDRLQERIGFRTIDTEGNQILLNGKPIFLKGISIHEEAPFATGRVTHPEQCRTLLRWARDLGCNFVRLAHYPHNEDMVRMAEEMGLLVWSEIPVYWTIQYENPDTYANAENQLFEMISRDKNRASVILWSIANETPVSEARNIFLGNLARKAREWDGTRLITAALDTHSTDGGVRTIDDPLGAVVDVIGINNYCGWYSGVPESCANMKWANPYNKPVILSEFGAGALQGYHGTTGERWTEEYQDAVYRNNIAMMQGMEFLSGTSPWILMDFRSARRHLKKIQKDFNRKGLISEQGIRKKAFYTLQRYYQSKD